jgi:tRNA(fMet)-specific endonuclease VapC
MEMKKVILDTNAVSTFFRGNEEVLATISGAEAVYMSVIVLGELYTGFKNGTKEKHNRLWLSQFLAKPTVQVFDVTIGTADIFSVIMHALRKKGTPIPINDIWLAAQAFETGSALVTFDSHFKHIQGLRLAL